MKFDKVFTNIYTDISLYSIIYYSDKAICCIKEHVGSCICICCITLNDSRDMNINLK